MHGVVYISDGSPAGSIVVNLRRRERVIFNEGIFFPRILAFARKDRQRSFI